MQQQRFCRITSSQVLQYSAALSCLTFITDNDRKTQPRHSNVWYYFLIDPCDRNTETSDLELRSTDVVLCFHRLCSWTARLTEGEVWGSISIPAGPVSFWCICTWKIIHWVPLLLLSVWDCSVADTYYIKYVSWGRSSSSRCTVNQRFATPFWLSCLAGR